MKRPRLTVEDHILLGNRVKRLRADADSIFFTVQSAFGKSNRAARAAGKVGAYGGLGITISGDLDDKVCALVPRERDPRNMAIKVYYGKPFVREDVERTGDDFSGWRVARDLEEVAS
jgi:hypothetical protein